GTSTGTGLNTGVNSGTGTGTIIGGPAGAAGAGIYTTNSTNLNVNPGLQQNGTAPSPLNTTPRNP
ncbi:MAG: hypothetical protein ACXWIU_02670, partial [Limisphaerales bacterium]